jgi:hypothetical protein
MNTNTTKTCALVFAIGLLPALGACNRDAGVENDVGVQPADEVSSTQTVRVTGVELGRSVGSDGRITERADSFRPNDTIYASVNTEGTATGTTLSARWTFEDGQVVDERSQPVSSSGAVVTAFHIAKPDGFPAGRYKVEIRLNGQVAESKDFEVK